MLLGIVPSNQFESRRLRASSSERAVRGAANSQDSQCREGPHAARDRAAQLIGVQVPARVVVGARSARGRERTVASMP